MKMYFENGAPCIIIQNNDEIKISTSSALIGKNIHIRNNEGKLIFSGDHSLIANNADTIVSKKEIEASVYPSTQIVEKCDKWIESFKKVHDIFRKLVMSERYKNHGVIMELTIESLESRLENTIKGKTTGKVISLKLMKSDSTILDGISIAVDNTSNDVCKYLAANVISYYLSQNYKGVEIDSDKFTGTLCSNVNDKTNYSSRLKLELSTSNKKEHRIEYSEYFGLVQNLFTCHNISMPYEQTLTNLRENISGINISERFDESYRNSLIQYGYISRIEPDITNILGPKNL